MSPKLKIIEKLDVRWERYNRKTEAAKRESSIFLWRARREAVETIARTVVDLLCVKYNTDRCERVLRSLLKTALESDTEMSQAIVYVLDDIL